MRSCHVRNDACAFDDGGGSKAREVTEPDPIYGEGRRRNAPEGQDRTSQEVTIVLSSTCIGTMRRPIADRPPEACYRMVVGVTSSRRPGAEALQFG